MHVLAGAVVNNEVHVPATGRGKESFSSELLERARMLLSVLIHVHRLQAAAVALHQRAKRATLVLQSFQRPLVEEGGVESRRTVRAQHCEDWLT